MSRWAPPLLALFGLVAPALPSAAQEDGDMIPVVSVSGRGVISAAPDTADVNVGVVSQAATAREALSANNQAMAALIAKLKESGVAEKDVQTTNLSIQPRYSQPAPQPPGRQPQAEFVPRIVGYDVTNTVRVTARDLAKLGTLLDALVGSGANQMYGISFRIDEPEKLLDEARKRAMADAKRKATLLAGEAGVVLGTPIAIAESGGGPPPPMPMFRRGAMMAAEAVPVAPGEQDLTVNVQVSYRIEPPK